MKFKYISKLSKIILVTFFLAFFNANAYGGDQWDAMVERFLLPLTYPDFNPEDLGKETNDEDKALLLKYKPDIYIAPNGVEPLDFYADYLPNTEIVNGSTDIIKSSPDRRFLKKVERKKGYSLNFTGLLSDLDKSKNIGYGQVIKEVVRIKKNNTETIEEPMIFLRYNFVFPKSGLPAKISWFKEIGASIIGDPDMWHILDIHGAIYIVLNNEEKPVAVILAQHNYHRTYIINKDIDISKDNKVKISFSKRSNEPYPSSNSNKPVFYWAADTPERIEYILTGKEPSLKTGEDVVYGENAGGVKIDYDLRFLPDKDPLYTSWISLGNKLKLFYFFESWYRNGPPGMDLRTWPRLKKYGDLMQFWYIQNDDQQTASFMQENIKSFFDVNFEPILERNGARFYNDLINSSLTSSK